MSAPYESLSTGLFITFEGIDGSGKSTQIDHCNTALEAAGYQTVITRNPGGTELGLGIRQMLLHHPGYVSPTCELLLYVADRAQHMDEVVFPALSEGKIVLCDRHIDSTVAYQGYGRELDKAIIEQLNTIATQSRQPDITFLFDADPAILLERVNKRGAADRLEREKLTFYEKTVTGYRTLAEQCPKRIKVLDALQSIDSLHNQVIQHLSDTLNLQHLTPANLTT